MLCTVCVVGLRSFVICSPFHIFFIVLFSLSLWSCVVCSMHVIVHEQSRQGKAKQLHVHVHASAVSMVTTVVVAVALKMKPKLKEARTTCTCKCTIGYQAV